MEDKKQCPITVSRKRKLEDEKTIAQHHHLDCSVCREILREIPSFFGMFFIDWHKAMWDDQANMRPW